MSENPLAGLVSETTTAVSSAARKRGRREGARPAISLGHIAFLLVGIALGASTLQTLNYVASLKHARQEEQEAEQPAPPVVPKAVAPRTQQLHQATSPVEAVRVMLRATLSNDKETAYAQWEIAPNEAATMRSGQALTLAELTALTYEYRDQIDLQDYAFVVKSQSGDEAQVTQTRDAVVMQVYSLHRSGDHWKIRYAAMP